MKKSSIALSLLMSLSPLAAFAATAPLDLVGPVSDYKIYVTEEIGELVIQTQAFTNAINKGDLATAKKLYAPTRVHYESIEPIAELFSDLDASIDSRVDDHEKGVTAEDFTGFHRIEYALFSQNSTKGLEALTAKLNADVNDLKTRVDGLTFPPEKVVGGAAALLEEVAATKISGEEDRYSHTDLYDFQGNIDGAKKIVDLFRGQIEQQDKAFLAKVDKNFASVDKILAKYKTPDGGFETYDKVKDNDRKALVGPVNTLAEDLSTLRGKLGLN
ncbi:iron uptake system protein EfeO [Pseudomonas haemolytica]|uniref:Iron uptake system protein EfeO n=1 Tax=Pseudomonas haemolytica TaxID=2600065 RepID=A0A5P1DHM7_9PSED|nr:iron uptake system protein EfeO [Pseudomonas haemolytica]MBJ2246877.1 iron uptake system protein EfeO [Pseudomonas haemolytica]MBJ2274547.1 iron uptake system protein EfeO [Pseudomonas haemolytica]MBK3449615.1 iron uptake system protein EfeO [Pseudomonas haemolytica]MBK3457476.1 iron uptake system protein EfeO [Pseudomonas haemolytica]MRJ39149.1 iron uptake system protein EfeO [Pseudomonas haemolytica]